MATVYLAEDVKHQREVAIKVLRPELAAMLGAERFLNEIRVTAHLTASTSCRYTTPAKRPGCFTTLCPTLGVIVRAWLERETQLPFDDALRITREVADALRTRIARGVVHRTSSPRTIPLEAGHAVVVDFGIAGRSAPRGATG